MKRFEIQERTALVTGAGRRIGAAIAESLHASGYHIALHCNHSLEEAKILAKKWNTIRPESAEVFQADLSLEGAALRLIKAVETWRSDLNLLINNASLFIKNDNVDFQIKDWQTSFILNVQVPFELSIYARPMLARNAGNIINITDIHASTPLKGYEIYCQSKAALEMQTKALAKAFAPKVRVNAIAPGAIAWPENDNALNKEQRKKIVAKTPLQCHGNPIYIAEAVQALIANPFITGQVLRVDGGRSLGW